ncbi:MAG: ribosome assembly RNA-binding protein YhbY [Pseudomonadales bacterium]
MPGPNAQTALDRDTRRDLKRIAHHLDPVVLVGDQGISDALIAETERALGDHELIKVRIHAADRDARRALAEALAEACNAALVQTIGKITVLYRRNPEPNPKLSNLSRYSLG